MTRPIVPFLFALPKRWIRRVFCCVCEFCVCVFLSWSGRRLGFPGIEGDRGVGEWGAGVVLVISIRSTV